LEITGAKKPGGLKFDGISIRALLDPAGRPDNWPDRILVTDSQRVRDPIKWKQTAVMQGRWRLVNGRELYDIKQDPGQQHNVIDGNAVQAGRMRAFYDAWWTELEPTFAQTTEIHLGHPDHPEVSLTGHDWIQETLPPWNQQHIRQAHGVGGSSALAGKGKKGGQKSQPSTPGSKSRHDGHWAVKVITPGEYEIGLRRWPVEADKPITAALPDEPDVPGASKAFRAHRGVAIPVVRAILRIDGQDIATKPVTAADTAITFTTKLTAGSHRLAPVFVTADGDEVGAYYTVVKAENAPGARKAAVSR
jgi:arylsulfatase B